MRKMQPSTSESLKAIVEDVLSGMSEDLVKNIEWRLMSGSELCSVIRRTEDILNI